MKSVLHNSIWLLQYWGKAKISSYGAEPVSVPFEPESVLFELVCIPSEPDSVPYFWANFCPIWTRKCPIWTKKWPQPIWDLVKNDSEIGRDTSWFRWGQLSAHMRHFLVHMGQKLVWNNGTLSGSNGRPTGSNGKLSSSNGTLSGSALSLENLEFPQNLSNQRESYKTDFTLKIN